MWKFIKNFKPELHLYGADLKRSCFHEKEGFLNLDMENGHQNGNPKWDD